MMARIETLSAYRCTFSYLQRNNPLKEELQEKIKADIPPEYTFADFIEDRIACSFTHFSACFGVYSLGGLTVFCTDFSLFPS